MTQDYDIAVVGGGLAGASLACTLADSGLSIALIEAVAFDAPIDANRQARTTAIAWGTRVMFESCGLWRPMADAAAPITRLHVSQRATFGRVQVAAEDYAIAALGYVVPNMVMIEALRARLAELDSVDIIAPARFQALRYRDDDRVELSLTQDDDARTLTTRLLIGADGARSEVRAALGIGARVDDYQQSAVITVVEPERAHNGCAYERFDADGPVALLPRSAHSCAVVWSLPSALADELCATDEADFTARLQAVFGQRLGALKLAGPRGAYPLARVLCDKASTERAVLIGNAGHALHPAAAQGFNLAIRDALGLAATLREQQTLKGAAFDPGDADMLAGWAAGRRPDQHRVANFTDGVVRLFSNRGPGLAAARSAGLFGLSLAPGIRGDMARRSMGLALVDDAAGAVADRGRQK